MCGEQRFGNFRVASFLGESCSSGLFHAEACLIVSSVSLFKPRWRQDLVELLKKASVPPKPKAKAKPQRPPDPDKGKGNGKDADKGKGKGDFMLARACAGVRTGSDKA